MARMTLVACVLVALSCVSHAAVTEQQHMTLSDSDKRELMGFFHHLEEGLHHLGHDIHKDWDHLKHDVEGVAHKVGEDVHHLEQRVGHGIHDLVHDIGNGFEHVWHEIGDVAIEVWHDAEKGLKFVMQIYNKFEAGLLKVNEKLFGKKLGYILDKIENAAIDQIPGVGTIVKVIAAGEDITSDIKNAKQCWQAKNWECVAGAVTSAVTTVADGVTASISSAQGVVNGIEEGLKIAGKVVTVGVDIDSDYKAVKSAIGEFKDHDLTVADAVDLVNSLGSSIDSMAQVLEGVLPSDWSGAVHVLKAAVAGTNVVVKVVDDADTIYLDGVQISKYVGEMKSCFDRHDYLCVGKEIAGMIGELGQAVATVENDLPAQDQSEAMKNLASALVSAGSDAQTVLNVADAIKGDAKQFQSALKYFSAPVTVARVKQGLSALSSVLSELASQITELDPLLHGKLLSVVQSLEHDATVASTDLNRGVEVIASGQQVWSDLQAAAADFKAHKWAAFAQDIATVCNDIVQGIEEQTQSMKEVVAALLKVSKDATEVSTVIGEVKQDYAAMRSALSAFESKPLTAQDIETGLSGMSKVFGDLSSQLTQVSSFLPSKLKSAASFLSTLASRGSSLLNKGDELVVSGVTVISDAKQCAADASAKNWEQMAQCVSKLASDCASAIEQQTENAKQLVAGLLDVSTDAQEVAQVIGQVKSDMVSIQSAVSEFSSPFTVARFESGIRQLASVFSTLSTQLHSVSGELSGDLAQAANKLAHSSRVLSNEFGEVDRVIVDGQNLSEDFGGLERCAEKIDISCVVAQIKKIVNALKEDRQQLREENPFNFFGF